MGTWAHVGKPAGPLTEATTSVCLKDGMTLCLLGYCNHAHLQSCGNRSHMEGPVLTNGLWETEAWQ